MDESLSSQRIATSLESIANSLKVIAERAPNSLDRIVERVYAAVLMNSGEQPTANRARELANELAEDLGLSGNHVQK